MYPWRNLKLVSFQYSHCISCWCFGETPFLWNTEAQFSVHWIVFMHVHEQMAFSPPKQAKPFTFISWCWMPFHQNLSPSVRRSSPCWLQRQIRIRKSLPAHHGRAPAADYGADCRLSWVQHKRFRWYCFPTRTSAPRRVVYMAWLSGFGLVSLKPDSSHL